MIARRRSWSRTSYPSEAFYALIAYEARVGLAAILKKIPNLVLCDVGLPEMSGFEILATVNASCGIARCAVCSPKSTTIAA